MALNFKSETKYICCFFVSIGKARAVCLRHRCWISPFITSEATWISGFSLITRRFWQGQIRHFTVYLVIKASLWICPKGQLTSLLLRWMTISVNHTEETKVARYDASDIFLPFGPLSTEIVYMYLCYPDCLSNMAETFVLVAVLNDVFCGVF